jgi:Vibrio phage DNA polymerase
VRKNPAEKIGVLDFETDPFVAGRIPYPFASCIYFARNDYALMWEPDIIAQTLRALRRLPVCTLYAHNGGKFDFHFLIENAKPQELQIRNGRVVQMQIGKVTLKDSWPLMPFALEEYKKTKIDYSIFEKHRRNIPRHREKIREYLLDDCIYLHELLTGFRETVGPKDTIGSSAFYQMRQLGIKIQSMNEQHDELFRPFFFGGRVEAFARGIHNGRFLYLDINSAYPFAMLHNHPHGSDYLHGNRLPPRSQLGPCFIRAICDSRGALPFRAKDGSLTFPHIDNAEFLATGWEFRAGLETRTLHVRKVLDVWLPRGFINFREYVETFFALRQQAKKSGDDVKRLAYKYLLNSGFGKFAQNPREFKTYRLARFGDAVAGYEWETDYGAVSLWAKPSYQGFGFYDVATGASITGFERAVMWRGICASRGTLYCDTDAIICKSTRVQMGDKLGQWKIEGKPRQVAIAGKKLYAVDFGKSQPPEERYKIASKGARLTYKEILALCRGSVIEWQNEAPTFSLTGAHFVKRRIRQT